MFVAELLRGDHDVAGTGVAFSGPEAEAARLSLKMEISTHSQGNPGLSKAPSGKS